MRSQPQGANAPLRICLTCYRGNPYSGGQGIYLSRLSSALAAQGHQVDVVTGPPYPHLDTSVRLIQLPSFDLHAVENRWREWRWRYLRSYTDTFEFASTFTGGFPEPYTFGRRLVRWFDGLPLRGREYDIVHDNQTLCYGLLPLQRRLPLISTLHHPIGRDLETELSSATQLRMRLLKYRWYSFLYMQRRVAPQLRHITTISQAAATDLTRYLGILPERMQVISNCIDTDVYQCPKDVTQVPGRIFNIASSDIPMKGLTHLLHAVARLLPKHPHLHLISLSKLRPDSNIPGLIERLGLGQVVRFITNLSEQALVRHYAEAEIVAVPSLYEGFGLPLAEAMACGAATVTTSGGALPEVAGNAARIVPPGDSEALAQAINHLVENPQQRQSLGKAARARIEEKFSTNQMASAFETAYRRAIAHENH